MPDLFLLSFFLALALAASPHIPAVTCAYIEADSQRDARVFLVWPPPDYGFGWEVYPEARLNNQGAADLVNASPSHPISKPRAIKPCVMLLPLPAISGLSHAPGGLPRSLRHWWGWYGLVVFVMVIGVTE